MIWLLTSQQEVDRQLPSWPSGSRRWSIAVTDAVAILSTDAQLALKWYMF